MDCFEKEFITEFDFPVFGSCLGTLAVILVSDFFLIKYLISFRKGMDTV